MNGVGTEREREFVLFNLISLQPTDHFRDIVVIIGAPYLWGAHFHIGLP